MSVHRGDAYLADLPHGGKWTETQTNAEWLIHLQRNGGQFLGSDKEPASIYNRGPIQSPNTAINCDL